MKFVDLPANRSGRTAVHVTPEIVAALQERPTEWALVHTSVHQRVATACRQWAIRHPGFESAQRSCPGGLLDVYLRYVGGK